MQIQIHKTHHNPDLGEAITFPLIVYSVASHGTNIQMAFCPGTLKIPIVGTPMILGTHNFVCKPPIEMRSEANFSSRRELSNGMLHATYTRGNRGDS
jgi:hypothetical protein